MTHIDWLLVPAVTPAPPQNGGGRLLSEDTAGETTQEGQDGGAAPAQPQQSPFGSQFFLIAIFVILGLMIFSTFSGSRREKKRRKEMLGGLGKHDRVQTVGGIIGSVVEIKGDELTLRVDEASNTRIRVARSAVQQVLKSSGRGADEPDEAPAAT